MFHWTDNNIAVHTFTCVLALQIAHLMRLKAERAGHHLSVRTIPSPLGRYRGNGADLPLHRGRPEARRVTTDLNTDQRALHDRPTSTAGPPPTTRS